MGVMEHKFLVNPWLFNCSFSLIILRRQQKLKSLLSLVGEEINIFFITAMVIILIPNGLLLF
jgi:hypothetical protein